MDVSSQLSQQKARGISRSVLKFKEIPCNGEKILTRLRLRAVRMVV